MDETSHEPQGKSIPLYKSQVWQVKRDNLNVVVIDLKSEVSETPSPKSATPRKKRR